VAQTELSPSQTQALEWPFVIVPVLEQETLTLTQYFDVYYPCLTIVIRARIVGTLLLCRSSLTRAASFCRGHNEHTSFAAQVGTRPNPKNNISKKHMMKALHFFLVLSLYYCLPSLPAAAHSREEPKPDSVEVRRVLSKCQTQFLHTLHTKNGNPK
jgi:hypothetical protein